MSKTPVPFHADDISALARSLKGQLAARQTPPGHVELLNMLARAAGAKNFQHLRAQATAPPPAEAVIPPASPPVDAAKVERLARYFDAGGRMIRWPSKMSHVEPCLWVLWSRLPAERVMAEREVGARLNEHHLYGDPALLRRALFDYGLVTRSPDGREYRRIEREPPPLARALMARVRKA